MNKTKKTTEEKIKEAIKRGELIPHEKILASFPKKRREKILRRARYLQIAIRLRELRRALRLSQEKLARKMKVKREFLSRIEGGQQNITLETLYKIAEAVGKEFYFEFR